MMGEAKTFYEEVHYVDREIERSHDAAFRFWLLGLRERLMEEFHRLTH